ncbi:MULTISPECIES: NADPH-dependent FMN reductase [unclassified Bartonella]|uniref:NADPH-dependent FMN reductase n=1 Tax=unclassified Bartonella TaxID=2645622 RepID=UPI0035D00443
MYTFVKTIADADDVILASPVYHRSYSETLKNAFDNLDCDAFWALMAVQQKMRYCHVNIWYQLCIRFIDKLCNIKLLQLKMVLRLRMKTVHGDLAA